MVHTEPRPPEGNPAGRVPEGFHPFRHPKACRKATLPDGFPHSQPPVHTLAWYSEATLCVRRSQKEWKRNGSHTFQTARRRCHHMLRTLPPTQSREFAEERDAGMQRTVDFLLGGLIGDDQARDAGCNLAVLPMRLGGFGLRSARRVVPGAYWAPLIDALHMIHERLPAVARTIAQCRRPLDGHVFVRTPEWEQLKMGVRPPPANIVEPDERPHGWQHHASSATDHFFRRTVVLSQTGAANQAHLRSHSGHGSSFALSGTPNNLEFRVEPHSFRTLVLGRMRSPPHVAEVKCEWGVTVRRQTAHWSLGTRKDTGQDLP